LQSVTDEINAIVNRYPSINEGNIDAVRAEAAQISRDLGIGVELTRMQADIIENISEDMEADGISPENAEVAAAAIQNSVETQSKFTGMVRTFVEITGDKKLAEKMAVSAEKYVASVQGWVEKALKLGAIDQAQAANILTGLNPIINMVNAYKEPEAYQNEVQGDYQEAKSNTAYLLALIMRMFSDNSEITREAFREISELNQQIEKKLQELAEKKLLEEKQELQKRMEQIKSSTSAMRARLSSKIQNNESINSAELGEYLDGLVEEFRSLLETLK
jgi:hypothetical protein